MSEQDVPALTPEACRAARALLRWNMRDLAAKAGVALQTVLRMEQGSGEFRPETVAKLCDAFALNGVELLVERGRSGAVLSHSAHRLVES